MNIININPDQEYLCSTNIYSNNFTSIMYLVSNTRDHPEYLEQIKYILDNNLEDINKHNAAGWSALMLATSNYKNSSSSTIELLLQYYPCHINALYYSFLYLDQSSSYDAIKLLIDKYDMIYLSEFIDVLTDLEPITSSEFNRSFEYVLQKLNPDQDNYKKILQYAIIKNNPDILELVKKYSDTSLDIKSALD